MSTRSVTFGIWLLAISMTPACSWFGGESKEEASIDAETFKKAVQAAKSIKKDPTKADAVLKEAGMSRSEFEAVMYQIATDEAASEKYEKALKEGK